MRTIIPLAAAAALLASTAAEAATRQVWFQQNGSGACQAALPAFEGLIRKRPMAIQNEGTAPAFVTCSPVTLQGVAVRDPRPHGIFIANRTAAAVTVNCTGVQGNVDGIADLSVPKSVTVVGNNHGSIYWEVSEGFDAFNDTSFSISCSIPPGVGITTLYTNHELDVGE